jgi:DNA-binding transcriptional regulator YhcF (GntR family)
MGHPPKEEVRRGEDTQPVGLEDANVDRHAEIPVGTQLVWALRARIADGRLAPGERLPGVRELADRFAINANTARAIYQRLEREGLVESRQGTGTFVGDAANERLGLGDLTADAARRARELGVDPRELAAALYVAPEPPPSAAGDPERRRQLRRQIAALEQALTEIESSNPGLLAPPASGPRLAGPRLLDVAELEQVRGRLMRRLAEAQIALDARGEASQGKRTTSPAADRAPKRSPAKTPKRGTSPSRAPRPSTA